MPQQGPSWQHPALASAASQEWREPGSAPCSLHATRGLLTLRTLRLPAPATRRSEVPALQEEARWDICRQAGWQEREELPLFLLPAAAGTGSMEVEPTTSSLLAGSGPQSPSAAAAGAGAGAEAPATGGGPSGSGAEDPSWLAQAEGAPLAAEAAAAAAAGAAPPPLWVDPQFRFVPLQPRPSQPTAAAQAGLDAAPWGYPAGEGPALPAASPGGGGARYLLHGSPALSIPSTAGFGAPAEYGRPSSGLSSSTGSAPAPWDHRRQ